MNTSDNIKKVLNQLNRNNSSTSKMEVLEACRSNADWLRFIKMVYDSDVTYGITAKQCIEKSHLCFNPDMFDGPALDTIENILSQLASRESLSGHDAIATINAFGIAYPEYKDLMMMILDRDIKSGIGLSTLEKVYPAMFPKYSVALSGVWDDKTSKKVNFKTQQWYASRKLDGCRCVCIKKNGKVTFKSRQNNEFMTLDVLKKAIEALPYDNFVLDGECCLVNNSGDEDFKGIVSEIKRKNHTIQNPIYMIFDCLTIDEFVGLSGTTPLAERFRRPVIKHINELPTTTNLRTVAQIKLDSEEDFNAMVEKAAANGWEGIMIRKNVGYEGKRSNNMLKVKKFQDNEYVVKECFNGPIQVIENGVRMEKDMLSYITIEHKGNQVRVGTGFSQAEREHYRNHPQDLIGKTITVKYFQESEDADGKKSLRFPTVKCIYTEGRNS